MNPVAALWLVLCLAAGLSPFVAADAAAKKPDAARQTIGTLKTRDIAIDTEAPAVDSAAQAMNEYRRFLALQTGSPSMRAEALRRLADLNLDAGVNAESDGVQAGAGAAYFAEAVTLYTELLELRRATGQAQTGDDADVLYQLSRAQEGAGKADDSLRTLDALVAAYPSAKHEDEAEFRRGETYFVRQDYPAAEKAYAAVLADGESSGFYEQSLYKHGWALFKQGRNEEGLASFLQLLERKLGPGGAQPDALVAGMSRPERELLDDTLRVTSITYSYLDGAESIPASLAGRAGTCLDLPAVQRARRSLPGQGALQGRGRNLRGLRGPRSGERRGARPAAGRYRCLHAVASSRAWCWTPSGSTSRPMASMLPSGPSREAGATSGSRGVTEDPPE